MESNCQQSRCGSPILQVMICTYGRDGLRRVAASSHPKTDGVEYLVSLQKDPDDGVYPIPEELLRDDFRLITDTSKGLSVNRNTLLAKATAPLLLISDDDVDYTSEGLHSVIDTFRSNPDMDIITFRYSSASHSKYYPAGRFDLSTPGKGYFVTSFEIALRRESVQGKIWFNENFGIGATFPSGEEDIFIKDCLDAGLKGMFEPATIARHDGKTTSGRNLMLPTRPLTKGAVFMRLHPRLWPVRMLIHAIREIPMWSKGLVPSPGSYCINWLKGVSKARELKVFPTPDYSQKYPLT